MAVIARNSKLFDAVLTGKNEFESRFDTPCRSFKAGEVLMAAGYAEDAIYRLQSGWAYRFCDLPDGTTAILDVYLPGDVIGLDAVLDTEPTENVAALTSLSVSSIRGTDDLYGLMAQRSTALYILWLQGQRQKRADRLLTTISSLDARGRLAGMILDFYTRLYERQLISQLTYCLPLTQTQIGSYLGLTLVHVNRVLKSLRNQEIVDLQKHWVAILNLEQLTKLAQIQEHHGSLRRHHRSGRAAIRSGGMDKFAFAASSEDCLFSEIRLG